MDAAAWIKGLKLHCQRPRFRKMGHLADARVSEKWAFIDIFKSIQTQVYFQKNNLIAMYVVVYTSVHTLNSQIFLKMLIYHQI